MSDEQLNLISNIPRLKLCKIQGKLIGIGFTASIYQDKSKVVKEIYSDLDIINNTKRLNELIINSIISKDEVLKKYSVPFYGYDICNKNKTLLLQFDYVGKNLYEQLTSLSLEEIKLIFEALELIIKIFNDKGISHNDLHNGNIFVIRDKSGKIKNVLLGDWGTGLYDNSKKDALSKSFYERFYEDMIMSYYFKNHTVDDAVNYLKDINKYKKLTNLFNKEKKYIEDNFSYRPVSFLKKVYKNVFIDKIKFLLRNDPVIIEKSGAPENILDYIKSLI